MHTTIVVQSQPFDPGLEFMRMQQRQSGAVGGVASFIGLVRDTFGDAEGGLAGGLYLEHYPGMTESSLEAIVLEAGSRWPLQDVVVIHRVGTLAPADPIVFVQTASAHRAAAFAGCEFIMDYLKTDAVFWKKEIGSGEVRWVDSSADDRARAAQWRAEASDGRLDRDEAP